MSTLNPIRIDRYTLYLDSLITITIDHDQPEFYKLTYSDGETLQLERSLKDELAANLPQNFLPYVEMWINDNFIMSFDSTWDKRLQRPVLITTVRLIGEIREYGTLEEIETLITQRIEQSTGALLSDNSEVENKISETVTPVVEGIVQPIVTQQITDTVEPIIQQQVTTEVSSQINLGDMGAFFNNQLNQQEDTNP